MIRVERRKYVKDENKFGDNAMTTVTDEVEVIDTDDFVEAARRCTVEGEGDYRYRLVRLADEQT